MGTGTGTRSGMKNGARIGLGWTGTRSRMKNGTRIGLEWDGDWNDARSGFSLRTPELPFLT